MCDPRNQVAKVRPTDKFFWKELYCPWQRLFTRNSSRPYMCIATALSKNLVLWTPVELFFRVDSHLLMLPSFCPPLIFLRGVHMLNYVRAAWCSSRLCYRYQISSKKEDRNARRSRFPKRAIQSLTLQWVNIYVVSIF